MYCITIKPEDIFEAEGIDDVWSVQVKNPRLFSNLSPIQVSIMKWDFTARLAKEHEKDVVADGGVQTCALCQVYRTEGGCSSCPVAVETGENFCGWSPYEDWRVSRTAELAIKEKEFLITIERKNRKRIKEETVEESTIAEEDPSMSCDHYKRWQDEHYPDQQPKEEPPKHFTFQVYDGEILKEERRVTNPSVLVLVDGCQFWPGMCNTKVGDVVRLVRDENSTTLYVNDKVIQKEDR